MFDWQNNTFSADYSLGSATLNTGLSNFNFGGEPDYTLAQTAQPQPTPSGGFFGDALKSVTATAETFLNGVSKVYALDNQINAARLQQKQIESGLELDRLKTAGSLELNKAQIAAQRDLGVLQAQGAVARAQAQTGSSGVASYVAQSSIPTPLLLIASAIGLYFFAKRA